MKKLLICILLLMLSVGFVSGCATTKTENSETTETESTQEENTGLYNSVNLADHYDTLVSTVKEHLTTDTYHSDEYNLDIPYGVYVPEGYTDDNEYPLVMFIPDSSLAGKDVNDILESGYGGAVWADPEVQTGVPAIILYPAYPEVVVDDHDGYTITDYVPATIGLIDKIRNDYKIDANRIYTTGQSMGAMTSMILASQNPDLFAASMFVDGQWKPEDLAPLATQTFCYFAAKDDTSAYEGMQESIPVWKQNGANVVEATWDGNWSHDELQKEAQSLVEQDSKIYCITWETGTIEAKEMGGPGGRSDNDAGSPDGEKSQDSNGPTGGGMGSVGVHMASFNYAYNCNTMVAWLLGQEKGE